MAKQVAKTPEMISKMQAAAGEGADVSKLPVWEAVFANTKPISKRGSIFNKARMSDTHVSQLADYVNTKTLPMQTLHQDGDELPIGRAFAATVVPDENGQPQAHAFFYLSPNQPQLAADLDAGVIDSVSVAALSTHALCSECGWDFMGDDATGSNFWNQTCANDHTIGENGVHLNLTGLDTAFELSLVGRGAVPGSKIVTGAKSALANHRLAASGTDLNGMILQASFKDAPPPKETKMDLTALVEKLTAAQVNLTLTESRLTTATTELTTLQARITELTDANTALAAAAAVDPEGAKAQLSAATADLDVARAFIRGLAAKALVATGGDPTTVDTMTLADMTAAIEGAQLKLAALFPAGGVTPSAVNLTSRTDDELVADSRRKAFKTR